MSKSELMRVGKKFKELCEEDKGYASYAKYTDRLAEYLKELKRKYNK